MGKLIHGLDMFHIAELTADTIAAATYETPEKLDGAVNVKVDPKTDSETHYADNGAYEVLNSMGDIDVELEATDLPLELQKKLFGHTEENGVQFASIDDVAIELALGFRAKISTGGYRYYWLLKGKPELLPTEHKTDEAKKNVQTSKLKMKFMPLKHNGRWKGQVEDSATFTQGADWFKQVVYKGEALPPTV
ncbi:major tail protein [Fictibacillus aquaticus]|uniref:Phage tail protein n=1 Tax=Fictibacillus aquaticus TaxID=2021314 RepID=A0A235F970_9BACL|nr:major tail protein [Fictibacillus aquaticus]OYD57870.1 phage tail protein [Fictibacillus aquaticus]